MISYLYRLVYAKEKIEPCSKCWGEGKIEGNKLCPICKGMGIFRFITCEACKGLGQIVRVVEKNNVIKRCSPEICSVCQGTGEIFFPIPWGKGIFFVYSSPDNPPVIVTKNSLNSRRF